ncbi:MAG: HAD hydrolase family protein, partial [Candidatus Aenigmarchaeota archaeon]|nr:HAD hydrolase family protein [Candidatus Aenigmarchaeota archaeon]
MNYNFCTDYEGEITPIDAALDVLAKLLLKRGIVNSIEEGEIIYKIISGFDDVTAELVRGTQYSNDLIEKLEYTSGDTLRLIPVFFKALDVTDKELKDIYKEIGELYPGAEEGAKDIQELLGTELNIISTSWDGFLYSMNDGIVPNKNIYGTPMKLDNDKYTLNEAEKKIILDSLEKIKPLKEIKLDESIKRIKDLDLKSYIEYLIMRRIFFIDFAQIPAVMEIYNDIRPIGSKEKAKAVQEAAEKANVELKDVICVGDSSTDKDMLKLVKENGGITWTHNGKNSILDSAHFNLVTDNYYITAPLIAIANRFGKDGLILLARDWIYDSLLAHLEQSVEVEIYTKMKQRLDQIFIEKKTPFSTFTYLPDLDSKELASLKDKNEEV